MSLLYILKQEEALELSVLELEAKIRVLETDLKWKKSDLARALDDLEQVKQKIKEYGTKE